MKRCFFMNERCQLLNLAAEISRKPSLEESAYSRTPPTFHWQVQENGGVWGFMGVARRKETTVTEPKRDSFQLWRKKAPPAHPRLQGTLVLFKFGSF